ncbi:MAG: hypothetical protein ACTS73_03835 [Arsenophonus sp. NEOnobi-MAG3]
MLQQHAKRRLVAWRHVPLPCLPRVRNDYLLQRTYIFVGAMLKLKCLIYLGAYIYESS